MTAGHVALTLVICAAASIVQATAGFGFALVAMPLLSMVIGPVHALAVISLVAMVNSTSTAVTAREHIEWRAVITTSAASVAAMPLGLLALARLDDRGLRIAIAACVALAATVLVAGFRLRRAGTAPDVIAGLISGTLSTSTGTSGPPVVLALQARQLSAPKVRATMATQFVLTSPLSIAFLAFAGKIGATDVWLALAAAPVLLLSWTIGNRLFGRIDQGRYNQLVIAMLFAIAAISIAQAL